MHHIKKWLYNKFLPSWCKDDLLNANLQLSQKIGKLEQENKCLCAYIDGLEMALKHQRRIVTINAQEVSR